MKSPARCGALAALLAVGFVLPLLAFENPLSSTTIRDAYFAARGNADHRTALLLRYSRRLPFPKSGPHVAAISLATPFIQVLEHTAGTANYKAQDAEQEFAAQSLPLLVRVQIDLEVIVRGPVESSPPLTILPLPDFYSDFDICLLQDKKIPALSKHVSLIFSDAAPNPFGVSGAIVELSYDPERLDSSTDATVVVRTPDGQNVTATFALGQLQ